ncbi:mas-related G-protein coupled receptor member X2-like [Sarcophilus harrisii]|uniref:mas-related G-protein coupled receptor member X2-like n=1 Tax=Sarcophilus harrisii TaxID=9305 RepID=UPI001301C4F1|nr:mas-related G-protein coupled receptor member X2-like [Sarcophilus harrisii]
MKILSLLIALLGLVGNGAVLWLLGFRIRRNPFSVYILNLAAADALFLCFSFLKSILTLSRVFDLTWTILSNFKFIFYTAGLSLLAAISTERCLSALFPLWYRCRRPEHTSAAVCAVLWALAGMLWLLLFLVIPYGFINNISSRAILGSLAPSSSPRPVRVSLTLLRVSAAPGAGSPELLWVLLSPRVPPLQPALGCEPLIYFFVGRLGIGGGASLSGGAQGPLGDEQGREVGQSYPHNPAQRLHS